MGCLPDPTAWRPVGAAVWYWRCWRSPQRRVWNNYVPGLSRYVYACEALSGWHRLHFCFGCRRTAEGPGELSSGVVVPLTRSSQRTSMGQKSKLLACSCSAGWEISSWGLGWQLVDVFQMYGICTPPGVTAAPRAQELCESRGGRPGLPVPDSPYTIFVDVKQHWTTETRCRLEQASRCTAWGSFRWRCLDRRCSWSCRGGRPGAYRPRRRGFVGSICRLLFPLLAAAQRWCSAGPVDIRRPWAHQRKLAPCPSRDPSSTACSMRWPQCSSSACSMWWPQCSSSACSKWWPQCSSSACSMWWPQCPLLVACGDPSVLFSACSMWWPQCSSSACSMWWPQCSSSACSMWWPQCSSSAFSNVVTSVSSACSMWWPQCSSSACSMWWPRCSSSACSMWWPQCSSSACSMWWPQCSSSACSMWWPRCSSSACSKWRPQCPLFVACSNLRVLPLLSSIFETQPCFCFWFSVLCSILIGDFMVNRQIICKLFLSKWVKAYACGALCCLLSLSLVKILCMITNS